MQYFIVFKAFTQF